MDLIKAINENVGFLTFIIGGLVWFIRLEGTRNSCEKEIIHMDKNLNDLSKQIEVLEIKHQQLDSKLVEQLSDVRESLARIEGALGLNKKGGHYGS